MSEALLLDEHHPPALAAELRAEGFDVVAVSGDAMLEGMPDAAIYAHARAVGRRVVTENIEDFAPLLQEAYATGEVAPVLFISPRRYPRNLSGLGKLQAALRGWLSRGAPRPAEDWLP
ncbi:MAG: DUF5615 family PIN-like protein [Propionibacteriaceae bacterium]|nr:DUF5615 family PIN-like protein [Propionibacteriaceae bacterium]